MIINGQRKQKTVQTAKVAGTDELLNREVFYTLTEARVLIEDWRRTYNTIRPHGALNYRPPAPETILVPPLASMVLRLT